MGDILRKLFCKHNWILGVDLGNGLWMCYCDKCLDAKIKRTHGDIEH